MNISYYVKLYGLTVPVFFVIDIIWLGVVAKSFYQKNLKYILSPDVNWTAAIIFYLIYIAGILIFAVLPAVAKDSLRHAAVWGALFGFFTYATYDLTNLAPDEFGPAQRLADRYCDRRYSLGGGSLFSRRNAQFFRCQMVALGSQFIVSNWINPCGPE
jgi:uncharacterized membrane protein